MRYIKLENGVPVNYSIEQLFRDYPDAQIYKKSRMPNEQLLAKYNVYPLITEAMPDLNEDETVVESTPKFQDGEWHQTWTIRKLTKKELRNKIKGTGKSLTQISVSSATDVEPNEFLANKELQEKRYNICKSCESFTVLTTCRECNCIMPIKVKLTNATCPKGKW